MQARSVEVHEYLTLPPSPDKKRHLLRQSEETDEEMTLDAFLYRSGRALSSIRDVFPATGQTTVGLAPLRLSFQALVTKNKAGVTRTLY